MQNFNLSFKTIWRQAPIGGKILIVIVGAGVASAVVLIGLYGPKY